MRGSNGDDCIFIWSIPADFQQAQILFATNELEIAMCQVTPGSGTIVNIEEAYQRNSFWMGIWGLKKFGNPKLISTLKYMNNLLSWRSGPYRVYIIPQVTVVWKWRPFRYLHTSSQSFSVPQKLPGKEDRSFTWQLTNSGLTKLFPHQGSLKFNICHGVNIQMIISTPN